MKIRNFLILAAIISGSNLVNATPWEEPIEVKSKKLCGSLIKEKASDINSVLFKQKNSVGNIVFEYHVNPMGKTVENSLSNMTVGRTFEVCVVGFRTQTIMVEPPVDFHTFDIVW